MPTAALVTPLSGSMARYGRASAEALRLWAERFAGMRIEIFDCHPDPPLAVRLAEQADPDLLFGPYGSGPMSAVAGATQRLVWNHGGAQTRPRRHVVNILAPASTYFTGALEAVHRADPDVRRACVRHRDTGFGRGIAGGVTATATRLGVHVDRAALPVDPSSADILLVAAGFRDEINFARRVLPGSWRACGFVGAGVEEVLAPLGPLREGLLGPAQWLPDAAPEPDEGPPASEFVTAYRERTGGDPPYPAAQAFAAGVIAHRCLREAGRDDAAMLEAARILDCTTLFGRFRLDPATGQQIGHRVLTVQWQRGARAVVWPPEQAQATLRYPAT